MNRFMRKLTQKIASLCREKNKMKEPCPTYICPITPVNRELRIEKIEHWSKILSIDRPASQEPLFPKKRKKKQKKMFSNPLTLIPTSSKAFGPTIMGSKVHVSFHQLGIRFSIQRKQFILDGRSNEPCKCMIYMFPTS